MSNTHSFASLALAPVPRQIMPAEGVYRPRSGQFILLEDAAGMDRTARDDLMQTGRIVQETLAAATGADLELTATSGADTSREDHIGATVRICAELVPQAEGYELAITPDALRLTAHDPTGAWYGAMTLRQIARITPNNRALPCLRIRDWPTFAHRGFMLDISRNKVPTMETLHGLIDLLSELKYNQLQLYTEHTFAYRNHADVWRDASPMTPQQVLELDVLCRRRHIELVPNQNTLGHMERWLKHKRYEPLAELPGGGACLAPQDAGSIGLVKELLDELLPHFSSRQVNVGLDEVFEVGRGRSRSAVQARGYGEVFLEYLLKVHAIAKANGRTMQFWGDQIVPFDAKAREERKDLIRRLPGDVIALVWGYRGDDPYEAIAGAYAGAGVPFYVCPGTSSWCSFIGRTRRMIANIRLATEVGREKGAIGVLVCDWENSWRPLAVALPGVVYGGAMAWEPTANRELDLPRVLDAHVFHDKASVMGRLVCELGDIYTIQGGLDQNIPPFAWSILDPSGRTFSTEALRRSTGPERLDESIEALDHVLAGLTGARLMEDEGPADSPRLADAPQVAEELRVAAGMARYACRLAKARLEIDAPSPDRIPRQWLAPLQQELETDLIPRFRRAWLLRNRPGGLDDTLAVFRAPFRTMSR